jgi:zinc transporter ZupT
MKKTLKHLFLISLAVLLPVVAFAATCPAGTVPNSNGVCALDIPSSVSPGISYFIYQFQQILNSIIPVLVAIGVVYFVWGVVQYVINDSEEAKKKGKDRIIYGIIGFAVIVGIWGLVNIIVNTFGLGGAIPPKLDIAATGGASCSAITSTSKFQDVLCYITGIINNSIIPLIFAVATVMFVWGVVQYFVINADEEKKRAQGKQFMIWGIVALAVMLSVWGLVGILGETFGVGVSALPHVTPPK